MRRWRAYLALLLLLAMTGCAGRELQTRAFVTVMAVDGAGGRIHVRLAALGPEMAKGGGPPAPVSQAVDGWGASLREALFACQTQQPRTLYLSTCRVLLLGSAYAARYSVPDLCTYLLRRQDFSRSVRVAVSGGVAADIVPSASQVQDPALNLLGVLDDPAQTGWLPRTDLGHFLVEEDEPGIDPVLPFLAGIRGLPDGAALFRRGRLVGTLDRGETVLYNLLKRSGARGIAPGKGGSPVHLLSRQVLLKAGRRGLEGRIRLSLAASGAIPALISAAGKMPGRLSALGVDPLGLGREFYCADPGRGCRLLAGDYRTLVGIVIEKRTSR